MSETVRTQDRAARTRVAAGRPFAALPALRVVATFVGAAMLLLAVFQTWIHTMNGDSLAFAAYWRIDPGSAGFWRAAAVVPLGCAILAILGLTTLGGWITRLAGAVAIVAFMLVLVQLARTDATLPDDIGAGLWLMLAGGVILLIGSVSVPAMPPAAKTA